MQQQMAKHEEAMKSMSDEEKQKVRGTLRC